MFDRPPLNALNLEFMEELRDELAAVTEDPPSAGLVITGEGRAFSAGVDIKEVPRYEPAEGRAMIEALNACVALLYGLPACTVGAINGHAIGGGLVLALACDFRIAADTDARFALAEVTAGIPYPACPLELLRAELAPGIRRRLMLSGDPLTGREAVEFALFEELTPADGLVDRALELARSHSAAASYLVVKQQLKADALAAMAAVIGDERRDPVLEHWI